MILNNYIKSIFSFFIYLTLCLSAIANATENTALNKLMTDTVVPFISGAKIPGTAIAIYYKDQEYYFNYGFADKKKNIPVTENTIFELASITKIFVTTLLAVEVKEGKIHLSDSAIGYIPRLAKIRGLPINNVKVVNLATHTSGFPRQMEQFGVQKGDINGFYNLLSIWRPSVPIGTQYKYSNIGFGFLGSVVEEAAGNTLPVLLKQKITQPLGMTHTYFKVPEDQKNLEAQGYRPDKRPAPYYIAANFLGGGALRSSAVDLMQFMKANLGIKVGNASPQLLSAMQFAQQPHFFVKPRFVMGLGWQRVKHGQGLLITKNGGNQGFSTFIGFSPSKQIGVVVLTNQAKSKATLLGNQILKGLLAL